MIAKYACDPNCSKGRLYKERDNLFFLSPFAIDRAKIIESTAFRRLEYKTQVFVYNEGDHYRNRLTHSIEVAEISKALALALDINSDLTETLALAHDIGHAPFGHAGEEALNSEMEKYGLQFNHNSHAIKLITELEQRTLSFNGLNLTWETIEGIAKHNGPLKNLHPKDPIYTYSTLHDLELDSYSSLESQIASLADDIAYNNHDIDDGFRSGLIFIEELEEFELIGDKIKKLKKDFTSAEKHKIIHEAIKFTKNQMIYDLINTTKNNIKLFHIETSNDIRYLNRPTAQFSPEMENYSKTIKAFLMSKVYRSKSVNLTTDKGKDIIKELFRLYIENPRLLPKNWYDKIKTKDAENIALLVGDFIACMSDKYAIKTHQYFTSVLT